MKRLTLLRHAKSGWDDPGLRDFDRPLNDRGRRAADAIGRHIRDRDLRYDWIVASPAARVRETIAVLADYFAPDTPDPVWDERAYLASAATLLDIVRETPADYLHLLIVGHNPGLEEFALSLAKGQRDTVYATLVEKYPTATMTCFRLDCDHWADCGPGGAHLERFIRPRDLDPDLGPED